MTSPSSGEPRGFAEQYTSGKYKTLFEATSNQNPEFYRDFETLSAQIVDVVAGFVSLRSKEGETEREIFLEVFEKLIILESKIRENTRLRATFLSWDQQFYVYQIAALIAQAKTHYTTVLNYSQPQ